MIENANICFSSCVTSLKMGASRNKGKRSSPTRAAPIATKPRKLSEEQQAFIKQKLLQIHTHMGGGGGGAQKITAPLSMVATTKLTEGKEAWGPSSQLAENSGAKTKESDSNVAAIEKLWLQLKEKKSKIKNILCIAIRLE